ncbi:chromosome segregation protein SMC [Brucellaceae bacterium C25G]
MRFSKLRLLGFKSFVEPMEFIIETGLTGVVGPNGCGKSNLVEALRWVMGENSYKNMRASGMDDVIFSGSGSRPARNSAEVTLFLDNSDHSAPSHYNDADELQVSRRIEREAGSVYRINGKDARAKDVQLLFADQSTGARSPSMVGQGRIGELIQAKPQARRALLEEAAGISGLYSRRHEAELRLRGAESNLERLEDVIGELGSQIDSLKRQARQASRFKNLSSDIRKLEATLLHLRWSSAKLQEGEAQSALAEATIHVGDKAQAQMNAAKEQGVGAYKLPQLREQSMKAAAAMQRLKLAREQLDQEAERIRQRRFDLMKRLEQLSADLKREEQLLRENADIMTQLDDEAQALQDAQSSASERDIELQSLFNAAEQKLHQSEALLAEVTTERANVMAERGQMQRALQDLQERRDRFVKQLDHTQKEMAVLNGQLKELPSLAEKTASVKLLHDEIEAGEDAVLNAESLVADARENVAFSRNHLERVRTDLNRIETEAQTLKNILSAGDHGGFSTILEKVTARVGYEVALGAALGEALVAALDETAPAYWTLIEQLDSDPDLPQGVVSLADFVDGPEQLTRRLRQIGVVETNVAMHLQANLVVGQSLVDLQGQLWRWDGYIVKPEAPTMAAQRLAQQNRLVELQMRAISVKRDLNARENVVKTDESTLADKVEMERLSRDRLRHFVKQAQEAREALSEVERASAQLSSRVAVLQDAQDTVSENLDEAQIHLADGMAWLEKLPAIDAIDSRLNIAAEEAKHDRQAMAAARAAYDGLSHEARLRESRLAMIDLERKNWKSRIDNAHQQVVLLNDRQFEMQEELEILADAPDNLARQLQVLLSEISVAETNAKTASDNLQDAENTQSNLDKAAIEAMQALSSAREVRIRAEERLNAAEERRKEAEERIAETLQCPAHEAIRQTGLGADDVMPDAEKIERQLEQLKTERERLGAVNLRAEDEQSELSGRLDEIINEREDIIEAIKKLRLGIQNLNREGRERLLAAFSVVNTQFQRLFTHLFGGGTAELQLIESDDPLEAGLEILARPPGKKPQTMTLLSGGEQALTAMALIFAVFLTNPAPICVLDEVDAPLDDHNVERYCNLMDEMVASTETRFIVITHNPITMARMNRLYGVTMAEQGVSQLVSVDLQAAEKLVEIV